MRKTKRKVGKINIVLRLIASKRCDETFGLKDIGNPNYAALQRILKAGIISKNDRGVYQRNPLLGSDLKTAYRAAVNIGGHRKKENLGRHRHDDALLDQVLTGAHQSNSTLVPAKIIPYEGHTSLIMVNGRLFLGMEVNLQPVIKEDK